MSAGFAAALSMASQANPLTFADAVLYDICVGFIKRMTVPAMCPWWKLPAARTFYASTHVLAMSHSFKVLWPNTCMIAAQVIPFKSSWRFTNKELMSPDEAPSYSPDLSITTCAEQSYPYSATIRAAWIDFRLECSLALFRGILCGHLKLILSGVKGTDVSASRPYNYTRKGA